jgi:hypothetical protein
MKSNVIQLGRLFPKCSKVGCSRIPGWAPVLILRPPAPLGDGKAEAVLPLKFCHMCRLTTGWQDLVTNEGWAMICQNFHEAGRPPPERSRTELVWRS